MSARKRGFKAASSRVQSDAGQSVGGASFKLIKSALVGGREKSAKSAGEKALKSAQLLAGGGRQHLIQRAQRSQRALVNTRSAADAKANAALRMG